jgi:hypothetical protein
LKLDTSFVLSGAALSALRFLARGRTGFCGALKIQDSYQGIALAMP